MTISDSLRTELASGVRSRFPDALGYMLVGSFARKEAGPSSDIDLLVLQTALPSAIHFGCCGDRRVEYSVRQLESCRPQMKSECDSGRPLLIQMLAEGEIFHDPRGYLAELCVEARQLFTAGPHPIDATSLTRLSSAVLDLRDDLVDASDLVTKSVIAAELVPLAVQLLLRGSGRWFGRGRWAARELQSFSEPEAERWRTALTEVCLSGATAQLAGLCTGVLEKYGSHPTVDSVLPI